MYSKRSQLSSLQADFITYQTVSSDLSFSIKFCAALQNRSQVVLVGRDTDILVLFGISSLAVSAVELDNNLSLGKNRSHLFAFMHSQFELHKYNSKLVLNSSVSLV